MDKNELLAKGETLLDILRNKKNLFEQIYEITERQSNIIDYDNKELCIARNFVALKERSIKKINELDKQYEEIYSEISEDIDSNSEDFKNITISLEEVKGQLTRIILEIQRIEKMTINNVNKNLDVVENRIKYMKRGKNTVASYHKVMDNQYNRLSVFMDKKK